MPILFLIFFFSGNVFSQSLEIRWTDTFRKEIHLNCEVGDKTCLKLCGDEYYCKIEEKPCRSCIGTSIGFNYLLESLGTLIKPKIETLSSSEISSFLKKENFITLTSRDVYNIIDPMQSLRLMKKFDALCPSFSFEQILLVEVDETTRKLKAPRMVYCAGDKNEFYPIETEVQFQITP